MKIFISGPISDNANWIYEFAAVERKLYADGYEVVSPRVISYETDKKLQNKAGYGDYLRATVDALFDCDAILMMNGWKESKGSTAEYYVAKALGLEIIEE